MDTQGSKLRRGSCAESRVSAALAWSTLVMRHAPKSSGTLSAPRVNRPSPSPPLPPPLSHLDHQRQHQHQHQHRLPLAPLGMNYVAQVHTAGYPISSGEVEDHISSLRALTAISSSLGASLLNVHGGTIDRHCRITLNGHHRRDRQGHHQRMTSSDASIPPR